MTTNDDTQRGTGEHIRQRREQRGMSQGDFAEQMRELGFDAWRQTTVSRTEKGTRSLKWDEALAVEDILGEGLRLTQRQVQGVAKMAQTALGKKAVVLLQDIRESTDELEQILAVLSNAADLDLSEKPRQNKPRTYKAKMKGQDDG